MIILQKEAEKQLQDRNVYKDVEFTKKILQDLTENSNKLFHNLKTKEKIDGNQLSILHMNTKIPVIYGSSICYLRFIKGCMTCQEGL